MLLPHADKAYLPIEKLTAYLLSLSHPSGKSKAAFFHEHGFDTSNAQELAALLLEMAKSHPVTGTITTSHGIKYIIDGELATPHGGLVKLRMVWIMEPDDEGPRFVTAYPQ